MATANDKNVDDPILATATSAHQSGHLEQAATLYRHLLHHDDATIRAQAHHGLGVTLFQRLASSSRDLDEPLAHIDHALALVPDSATYHNSRGILLDRARDTKTALACFQRASSLHPTCAKFHYNAGKAAKHLGHVALALECMQRVVQLEPRHPEAHYRLGQLYKSMNNYPAAVASFRTHLALHPDNQGGYSLQYTRFWIQALSRDEAQDESVFKPEMIAKLFDNYADTFDEQLRSVLQYRTPEVLWEQISQLHANRFEYCCDLGCGTGLMGILVRPACKHLEGVDLSSQMVARARQRGLYDALAVDEIVHYLTRQDSSTRYDLIIAADVLVYVANLKPLFAAAAARATPNAVFAFSTEMLDEHDGKENNDGYRLRPTGRYAHTTSFVRGVCAQTGWEIQRLLTTPIRMNLNEPVIGNVIVAVKR